MASPSRPFRTTVSLIFFLLVGAFISPAFADISQEEKEKTYKQLEIFANILSILQENYVEEIDTQKAVDGAIQGLLQTLDPHSSYLKPEEFQELQEETSGLVQRRRHRGHHQGRHPHGGQPDRGHPCRQGRDQGQ